MAMPAQTTRRWTAREVRALTAENPLWTPRYELVDGELLVTPSPGPPHQMAVQELIVALHAYLARDAVGQVSHSPSDIELESESIVQPDVYVTSREEWRRAMREGFPAHELLVAIEVVSPSSGRHDRVTKRRLYQRHVAEYWIVDVDARLVERWWPGDERPEILTQTLEWNPAGSAAAFTLDLPRFFARVFGEDVAS